MNINWLKYIVLGVSLLTGVSSYAGLITDVEEIDTKVNRWHSASWTHNLLEPGDEAFELGSAISGNLEIEFSDDGDWGAEFATIIVGQIDFHDGDFFYIPHQDWGGGLGMNSMASINSTGTLDITIWSAWGDFYIGDAFLTLVTDDVTGEGGVDVAEPSSLVLLGLGLVGLGFCRRKNAA